MTAAPTRADVAALTELLEHSPSNLQLPAMAELDALLSREAQLREALEWIDNIATMNYEQDEQLRHNGARTLIRISDKARAALNTRSAT